MPPNQSAAGSTAILLLAISVPLLTVVGGTAARALDFRDEVLAVAEEQIQAQGTPAGESVGEPAREDATVEGEPGPGDAVEVPPEDTHEGNTDETPPVEDGTAAGQPPE